MRKISSENGEFSCIFGEIFICNLLLMMVYSDFQRDFWFGETDLKLFHNCPYQITGCAVLLARKGEARVSVGIQEFTFRKNGEMIVLPVSTLTLHSSTDDFMCSVFIFSKQLYEELSLKLGVDFSTYLLTTPYYIHPESSIKLSYFCGLMNFAKIIHHQRDMYFWSEMYRNFVLSYLIYLYNAIQEYLAEANKKNTRKNNIYHRFVSLVNEYCKEHRDVSFYAKKLNITERYLWIITDYVTESESPKDIIGKRLILEMKLLLRSTDLTIKEIAVELSFVNQTYLGRYFKHHVGLTPSEYRKIELRKGK